MCIKLPPGDLNPGPYPPHPTSIYTCGVTTASRVHGGKAREAKLAKITTLKCGGTSSIHTKKSLTCLARL